MESIRSFLDSRAAIRYRRRSITDRFSKIATNPLRLESTRSLLDSCFSRFVTRIPRHFEIFQIESRIPDLGCRLVLAKAPSIARV